MLRFDKTRYLRLLFNIIYSVRLSDSLWRSDVLLFLEFINIVFLFVLYLYWIHYIFIYFFRNPFCSIKRYMICLISFNKISNVLPPFTCAKAIGSLWGVSLGFSMFNLFPCVTFIENIPLLRAISYSRLS